MSLYTCVKCFEDIEEDEVVWADSSGNVEKHTYAYCVECLPPQIPERTINDIKRELEEGV